jgi:hypothetical protein
VDISFVASHFPPSRSAGLKALGFWHIVTGIWLMYLTFATAVDFSLGWSWKI